MFEFVDNDATAMAAILFLINDDTLSDSLDDIFSVLKPLVRTLLKACATLITWQSATTNRSTLVKLAIVILLADEIFIVQITIYDSRSKD